MNKKDEWIRKRDRSKMFNSNQFMLKEGRFSTLDDIYLPTSMKYIAFDANHIFFTTYHDPYSIKYIKFWNNSWHEKNPTLLQDAEINYGSGKWLELKLKRKIIGLQAVNGHIFALTVGESLHDNHVLIYSWGIYNDGVSEYYVEYLLQGIEASMCGNTTRLVVCDTKNHTDIMLYGLDDNTVHHGRLRIGERKVNMQTAEKLSPFFANSSVLLCLKNKINSDREYVDYIGLMSNANSKDKKLELFVYRNSLSLKNASKPFVISRKNFLFANTPRGARASAIMFSIIETAKENGLNPFKYLVYVFRNAPNWDIRNDVVGLERLLPYAISDERRRELTA